MLKAEPIAGIITVILSVVFFIASLGFKEGTADGVPGPGYFPIIICALLAPLGILWIIKGIRSKERYFILDKETRRNLKTFFLTILIIAVYLALWNFLPFIVSTTLFLFVLNFIYERGLKYNILSSVVTTASIYLLFNNLFHVMLK